MTANHDRPCVNPDSEADLFGRINVRPVEQPKPLTFAQIANLAAKIPTPTADRLVCAPDVWDRLKGAAMPARLCDPLAMYTGLKVLVDETMVPGQWEIRLGDKVIRSSADPA